ncbi:TPA: 3'-5' exonuclease [Burkholderia lata]
MTKYLDVMVDLETTGTQPERTAIIEIAAVRFDFASGEIMPEMFNRCLMIPHGRFFDEETRNWWLKDKREILQGIYARMERPEVVMQAFRDFLLRDVDTYNEKLRLWAKPSHFEYPFLESYFKEFEIGNPFHYRDTNDMNSWIRGRYWPQQPPEFERNIPFEGDAHSALFDVLHQLKVLYAVRDHSTNHPSLAATGDVVEA